jgi:hypothetical protein
MTQLICLAYQPGAYGSFTSWIVDRFSAERKKHEAVSDDPLLPDGSGHKYVTYCKIQNSENFIAMMDHAKSKEKPWGYNIYAGWPVGVREDLNVSMFKALENLKDNDKFLLIECTTPEEHFIRYLRNEPTMDQARWYGMLEVTDEEDLYVRLKDDVEARQFAPNYHNPNFLRINMQDINFADANVLFKKITDFLAWELCDQELFAEVFNRRKTLQLPYYEQLKRVKSGDVHTPAERVVYRYIKGD